MCTFSPQMCSQTEIPVTLFPTSQQLKTLSYPLLFRLSIVSNSPIRLYSHYMMHNLQCVIQFLTNGQFKWSKKQQLTPESSSFVSFFMLCTAYLCWGMGIGCLARSSGCRNHWQIDFPFCFFPTIGTCHPPTYDTTYSYATVQLPAVFFSFVVLLVSQNSPFIPSSSFVYLCLLNVSTTHDLLMFQRLWTLSNIKGNWNMENQIDEYPDMVMKNW